MASIRTGSVEGEEVGAGVLGSLKGMGRGLYWIPKVRGAIDGLDLFASSDRSFALMGQKTLGRHCPQPRFTGAGTYHLASPGRCRSHMDEGKSGL